jgi:hypothetical protein
MATRQSSGWLGRGKQVEFPHRLQRHSQTFEMAMIVICILCIVVAVIIAKATDWGVTTRP